MMEINLHQAGNDRCGHDFFSTFYSLLADENSVPSSHLCLKSHHQLFFLHFASSPVNIVSFKCVKLKARGPGQREHF